MSNLESKSLTSQEFNRLKNEYFIVKIAGKGNVTDSNRFKLNKYVTKAVKKINEYIIANNKLNKKVLIIWDGDKYQGIDSRNNDGNPNTSPFTIIIAELARMHYYKLAALKPNWDLIHIETWKNAGITNIETYNIDRTTNFQLSNREIKVKADKIESYMVNNDLCDMYVSYGASLYAVSGNSGFQQLYGDINKTNINKEQRLPNYNGENNVIFYPFTTNYYHSVIYTKPELGFEIFLKDPSQKRRRPTKKKKTYKRKKTYKKKNTYKKKKMN